MRSLESQVLGGVGGGLPPLHRPHQYPDQSLARSPPVGSALASSAAVSAFRPAALPAVASGPLPAWLPAPAEAGDPLQRCHHRVPIVSFAAAFLLTSQYEELLDSVEGSYCLAQFGNLSCQELDLACFSVLENKNI